MSLTNLSPKQRLAIALGASVGVSHTAFRIFTTNFGPVTGLGIGVVFTFVVTYGIYWVMGLARKKNAEPS